MSLLSENASLADNYLEIQYHPHSGLTPKIIDLTTPLNSSRPSQDSPEEPYAPFPSIEDFEFIEHQVLENHTATSIEHIYKGINGKYVKGSNLQLKGYAEAKKCLDTAVKIYHGVCNINIPLAGSDHLKYKAENFSLPFGTSDGTEIAMEYTVWIKDGMEWLHELICDKSLSHEWEWHAHQKWLYCEGREPERIIDEPLSADDAWEAEVGLSSNCTFFH